MYFNDLTRCGKLMTHYSFLHLWQNPGLGLTIHFNIVLRAGLTIIWSWHVRNMLSLIKIDKWPKRDLHTAINSLPSLYFPIKQEYPLGTLSWTVYGKWPLCYWTRTARKHCLYQWLKMLLPLLAATQARRCCSLDIQREALRAFRYKWAKSSMAHGCHAFQGVFPMITQDLLSLSRYLVCLFSIIGS